jgi:RimK-like ATP-grasp domain
MTKTGPVTVASVSSCRPSAPQDLTLLPEPKLDSVSGRRLAIVARNASSTNRGLLEAAATLGLDALVLPPEQAARRLRTGDVALGRLDVLPTLDGPEPGLATLRSLEEKGVLVLNRAGAPRCARQAHDRAQARRARASAPPHRSRRRGRRPVARVPRGGEAALRELGSRRQRVPEPLRARTLPSRPRPQGLVSTPGALVQELVQPQGYDLRILVAAGEIVGAVRRVAARGEWRTNIALGGGRSAADPPAQACLLALGAAAALETDLVGVDLLPDGHGGWVALELNGAVDFTLDYSLDGESVFERVVQTLAATKNPPVFASASSSASGRER